MVIVTGPEKQVLSTQNTFVYIMECIFCSVYSYICAIQNKSVNCIEFLMDFCIYEDNFKYNTDNR